MRMTKICVQRFSPKSIDPFVKPTIESDSDVTINDQDISGFTAAYPQPGDKQVLISPILLADQDSPRIKALITSVLHPNEKSERKLVSVIGSPQKFPTLPTQKSFYPVRRVRRPGAPAATFSNSTAVENHFLNHHSDDKPFLDWDGKPAAPGPLFSFVPIDFQNRQNEVLNTSPPRLGSPFAEVPGAGHWFAGDKKAIIAKPVLSTHVVSPYGNPSYSNPVNLGRRTPGPNQPSSNAKS